MHPTNLKDARNKFHFSCKRQIIRLQLQEQLKSQSDKLSKASCIENYLKTKIFFQAFVLK